MPSEDSFEKRLTELLHRWDCPTSDELGDYYLGFADAEMQNVITQHLDTCVRCRQEVDLLKTFLDSKDTGIQPSSMFAWSTMPLLTVEEQHGLGLHALRGDTPEPMQIQLKDDLVLYVMLEKQVTTNLLQGEFSGTSAIDQLERALVEVWQDDMLVATSFIDELGMFSCELPQMKTTVLRIKPINQPVIMCRLKLS
jgi:hypothetical protein